VFRRHAVVSQSFADAVLDDLHSPDYGYDGLYLLAKQNQKTPVMSG
jgi:hypothetical protein